MRVRSTLFSAVLVAMAAAAGPGQVLEAHASGTAPKYVFSPAPIAPTGSLAANKAVALTLTTETNLGTATPGASVYLSFAHATGGGSAAVGATALTTTPAKFVSDGSAHVAITYTTPATLPTTGQDVIQAQDKAVSPTVHKSDAYTFAKAVTLNRYKWSSSPIAKPASLAKSAAVPITVMASSSGGTGIGGATIYLSLTATGAGLGTATAGASATPLSTTPAAFVADSTGKVAVTYHASAAATLPVTGTDTLAAQNTATSPSVTGADAYSYGKAAGYTMTPTPIATTGTLAANSTVVVTLTVKDGSGGIVAGAGVDLLFTQATGGGSATAGGKALGPTTAIKLTTNNLGQITIAYRTPAAPPVSGTDTIKAENATTSPTITATDSYTF